jgi:hypothetical protein
MVIGIVDSIFYHWESKGWWDRVRKNEGGEGVACNDSKKVLEVRLDNPTKIESDKDG